MQQEQLQNILRKAQCLAGEELGEQGELLVEMAAQRACAYCQREDIPREMEQAVAELALQMGQEGMIQAVVRGDTSITFAERLPALSQLLPFRRLGRLKEEK